MTTSSESQVNAEPSPNAPDAGIAVEHDGIVDGHAVRALNCENDFALGRQLDERFGVEDTARRRFGAPHLAAVSLAREQTRSGVNARIGREAFRPRRRALGVEDSPAVLRHAVTERTCNPNVPQAS